jgi:mRNA-degrading endonuclease toxin of MazEF toxin-antitoxin module
MNPMSGDIVLVDFGAFPFGHEQAGVRPAIFVSVMKVIAIVIPLTSKTGTARYDGT